MAPKSQMGGNVERIEKPINKKDLSLKANSKKNLSFTFIGKNQGLGVSWNVRFAEMVEKKNKKRNNKYINFSFTGNKTKKYIFYRSAATTKMGQ